MIKELTEQERKEWLRLYRSENVGCVTFNRLLDYYASPAEAIKHINEFAQRGGSRRKIKLCTQEQADAEIQAVKSIGARLIAACEPDYPEALRQISDAPPIITVLGCTSLLRNPNKFGIVGTRSASLNGKNMARHLSFDLAQADYVVVSGMARGIDTAAAEGALAAPQKGGTIAVLGTGIDVVYPTENKALYEQIKERGLLVSEFPFGAKPQLAHFPRRNRIISGLSQGVLVIEAGDHSGSLITAQYAAEQNREVFAVPGSPLDPRSQAPNKLLKQGAHLVETAEDIIDVLSGQQFFQLQEETVPFSDRLINPDAQQLSSVRAVVLENLSPESVSVDELIQELHLSAAMVNIVLVELELAGRLERFPGNRVALISEIG